MLIILIVVVLLVLLDYGLRWREGTEAHSIAIRTAKNRLALIVGAVVFVVALLADGLITGSWGTSLLLAFTIALVVTALVGVTTGRPEPLGVRRSKRG